MMSLMSLLYFFLMDITINTVEDTASSLENTGKGKKVMRSLPPTKNNPLLLRALLAWHIIYHIDCKEFCSWSVYYRLEFDLKFKAFRTTGVRNPTASNNRSAYDAWEIEAFTETCRRNYLCLTGRRYSFTAHKGSFCSCSPQAPEPDTAWARETVAGLADGLNSCQWPVWVVKDPSPNKSVPQPHEDFWNSSKDCFLPDICLCLLHFTWLLLVWETGSSQLPEQCALTGHSQDENVVFPDELELTLSLPINTYQKGWLSKIIGWERNPLLAAEVSGWPCSSMLPFRSSLAATSPLMVCTLAPPRALWNAAGAEAGLPLPCQCHDSGGLLNHHVLSIQGT